MEVKLSEVRIRNVRKSYGPTDVLNDVSIEIADGEFVVLVGPSGCGKSTLLRMIAGLEGVTYGDIEIGARRVNDLPPRDRDIAMVFQSYALYPHMTVAQNMGFSLKRRGLPKEDVARQVHDAAAILGLEHLLGRHPRELSGGQRQRVAMGRAIVRKPQVFLFDEPLSNLDAKLRVSMRSEIKQLHQRLKTTTVYVTHDQIEAMTMADRIVVMRDGIIEQVATPVELYDSPASAFVAQFIGSPAMNLLSGAVIGGALRFGDIVLPLGERAAAIEGKSVLCGIRPEHIILDGEAAVPMTIRVTETSGADTQIIGSLGEQTLSIVVRDRRSVARGDRLMVGIDPRHVHFFDAGSGRRINPSER